MKIHLGFAVLCAVATFAAASESSAATLGNGSATIDYDAAAWASLAGGANLPGFEALVLDEFFDQTASNARTGAEIQADEVQASPPYVNQSYAMNGSSVTNLLGRFTQPTTFAFTPGAPASHTGAIGLGGVTRWDVNPLLGGGQLLYGDFSLQYDPIRIGSNSGFPLNGSGWYLKANIPPAGAAFDLLNVSVTETAGTLSISGDLGVSFEVANFLYLTPGNQGADVGNLLFSATIVPEPSVTALVGSAAVILTLVSSRVGRGL